MLCGHEAKLVRWRLVGGVLALGLLGVLVLARLPIGTFSTKELDPRFIEISRPRYYLRHLRWSGIFPFEGGFIPDPHVEATEVVGLPQDAFPQFRAASTRIQGFDINPWFEDATAEILLAVEVNGHAYEYRVDRVASSPLPYGFINHPEPLIPFQYGDRLAVLTTLGLSRQAILSVAFPPATAGSIAPVFEGTNEFERVVQYLRGNGRYLALRGSLCRQWTPHRDFYERFEPCPPLELWEPT